jgi:hypothetical protein
MLSNAGMYAPPLQSSEQYVTDSRATHTSRKIAARQGVAKAEVGVWLAAFLVYAATTARDILPADSGEFQLIAAGWGIGHPPGYPLYTVVSALWSRLIPLGTVPFRVSLLSAALAATTLLVCLKCIQKWARELGMEPAPGNVGGIAAVLALGTAATFWAQATIANIRMPTMLFTAWGYLALAHYQAAKDDPGLRQRALISLGLATGLGIGHHPSLAFVAVGWALTLLLLTPRLPLQPTLWLGPGLMMAVAWAVPQLYLPLRGSMPGAPLAPPGLATWQGFWGHVLARGFGGDMFAFATLRDLTLRMPILPSLFKMQFSPFMLLGIAASWLFIAWRDSRIALALFVPWIVMSFVTITYRAPQTIEYLMPAYIPMALGLGLGVAALLTYARRALHPKHITERLLAAAVLLLLAGRIPARLRDFTELAADSSIRNYVEPLLSSATEDATILADWRWATPLWVLQETEQLGTMADVVYVIPEDELAYEDVWRLRAGEVAGNPVFTTHYYPWEEWTFAPVGGGFRIYPRPLPALPADLGFTEVEAALGSVQLSGFRWSGEPAPGATLELQIAWQAVGPQDPQPSLATRMWGDGNILLSAADQALGSDTGQGEIRFARLTHQLPIDQCSPIIHPTVSVYTVVDGTFQDLGTLSLPPVATDCTYPKLPTRRIWPGLVSPSGPYLRGIDYDVAGDDAVTAYLHWCGPGRPLVVQVGESRAQVDRLQLGDCQTVRLPLSSAANLNLTLMREDGTTAKLLSLPLPEPRRGERYLPYGNELVLIDDQITTYDAGPASGTTLLTLRWLTSKPLQQDYAISTRFLGTDGTWLGVHDMQPSLGAIPTLKWVVRNQVVHDPHPVVDLNVQPGLIAIVVYDRFRLTPLKTLYGDLVSYQLQ